MERRTQITNNKEKKKLKIICKFCGHNWEQFGSEVYECQSCGNCRDFLTVGIPHQPPKDLIDTWVTIGQKNPWIKGAYDPSFDRNSFYECKDLEELTEKFLHGNWCLGASFYLGNLCFINQVNAGDEWLSIRNDIPFESITMVPTIRAGELPRLIERFRSATDEQLKSLHY